MNKLLRKIVLCSTFVTLLFGGCAGGIVMAAGQQKTPLELSNGLDEANEDMQQLIQFLSDNKHIQMATVGSDGNPNIRTIQFQFYENGRIYFHTDTLSSAYRDLSANPNIAFIANSGDRTQSMTVRGETVFEYDHDLLKRIMDYNPNIKKIYGSEDNSRLILFYLEHGSAQLAEFSDERQGVTFQYEW